MVTYGENKTVGYLAPELEHNQTLDNLYKFGARLEAEYQKMLRQRESANIDSDAGSARAH